MRRMLLTPLLPLLALVVLAVAAPAPAHAVEVLRVKSPGGIEAWLVQDTKNPILTLRFAFRGGAALDPKGKAGLASMVSDLIDEGAGKLSSQEFQNKLQNRAIGLQFDVDRDTFFGRLKTVTENMPEAIHLLHLALTQPRFDKEPVARIRSQILSGLKQEKEDPERVAGKALRARMFKGSPYARSTEGTLETIPTITVQDMRDFMHRRIAKDNLVIGAVGDVTPKQLGKLLDQAFGDLPAHAASWKVPDIKAYSGGGLEVISQDVPQSAIRFAQPGIKRNNKDFYAAYVVNHVLGGGSFTSRLYQQIREKRGLAYSVYSYLWPLDHSALIAGGAGTADVRVKDTVRLIREEWAKLAKHGITKAELDNAKTYLTGSFALRFTNSGGIADMLIGMQLDHLGIDYFNKRNGLINAVDLKTANRVAKELWNPKELSIVVVGRPKGLPVTQ